MRLLLLAEELAQADGLLRGCEEALGFAENELTLMRQQLVSVDASCAVLRDAARAAEREASELGVLLKQARVLALALALSHIHTLTSVCAPLSLSGVEGGGCAHRVYANSRQAK